MDKRVNSNFEIDFIKAGNVNGKDFGLYLESDHLSAIKQADYKFASLVLLTAGPVNILNKNVFY